jgi:hypothetical protein
MDVTSQYTKVGSVLVPKDFIASKPHWAVFVGGQFSHFQRKVANQAAKLKATAAEPNKSKSSTPLQEVTNREPQVIKTRKTGRQKNVE